jgi:hypothetical protein
MSLLGHIRVSETHGIRRFLYPVSLEVPRPPGNSCSGNLPVLRCNADLSLIMADGRQVPLQVTPGETGPGPYWRLDFPVSLAPFEELELKLFLAQPEEAAFLDDPLQIEEDKRFKSRQRRFSIEFDRYGTLHEVIYDSAPHLRAPAAFSRNGLQAALKGVLSFGEGCPISARVKAEGEYPDGCRAVTQLETTACKSWVMMTHSLSRTKPEDELVFNLPLAVSSPAMTCDFGAGGGIYGRLHPETCPEIVWRSEFLISGGVRWSIAPGGRTDYVGEVQTAEDFLPQRWFHAVDGRKALAVAVTQIPRCCREMQVTLNANGDVAVAFKMGEAAGDTAAFGLCCHFLNDIPAIAAATNPQSILLPPVVTRDF